MDHQPGAWDKVLVDNQWSSDADHLGAKPMLLRDLYMSMQDMKAVQGGPFRLMQVETLKQQDETQRIPKENYERLLKEQIEGFGAEYKQEKTPHSVEMEMAKKSLIKMIADHSPMERLELIELAHKSGLLSHAECSQWLAQQQRKLVRAFGVPDANDEKVYDRIHKIVGQLPPSYQRDFEKNYEHMTNDRFRDYDNRPFPA